VCSSDLIETASMRLRATHLDITNDGDAGSVGDFYITVRLSTSVNGKSYDVANRSRVLVQGTDGDEISLTNISASAHFPLLDGMILIARISYFENDSGGPQASVGTAHTFVYNASDSCWDREDSQACVVDGGWNAGSLVLRDFTGSALDAELIWRFDFD